MLDKALEIIKTFQSEFSLDFSTYYLYKGDLYIEKIIEAEDFDIFKKIKRNNITNAIANYKKGLIALRFPENYSLDSTINTNNVIDFLASIDLLKKIGDSYLLLSDYEVNAEHNITESLKKSIESYQVVSTLIQKARKELTSDESKIQLTILEYETFIKIIQSSFKAYKQTDDIKYIELAFQNAERTKGSAVFDKISDQFALENSLIPDSIIDQQVKLNNIISVNSQKLFEENSKSNPDSILLDTFNIEIFNATREREKLLRDMEINYPDYFELKYSNSMLSILDVQQRIKEDQVVLEYILNETDTVNELFTFIVTTDEINFIRQSVTSNFIGSIESMFYFMSSSEYPFTKNEDSKNFCISSHYLYSFLIEPFLNKIHDKNLIVIPDGKLSYIPFDALLESLPDTTEMIEFNKLDYLIKNYSVNYSISANLLFKNIEDSQKTKTKVIAFAPEYNGETIEVAGKELKLIPLPGIRKEVEQISDILDTRLFLDEKATEDNFRENAENYDILHLAMHAFINDSLPAFSSMAFTQTSSNDNNTKGLLNTADIYNLKLKAKLTVLSACNTGTGKLLKGEGIMSLARGFLYAGCPSIIMSLWEVEDASGTQIMSSFYKNLKRGKTKDEALRAAKLEYLESSNSRRAHPHYWLGFVNIGDNASMFISYDFYFFILLVLALSGIGIDQLIRIKKARKKRA